MKSIVTLCFSLFVFSSSFSQNKKEKDLILALMNKQVTAWNNGDLNTFMDTYWKSDSVTFVGGKNITYGWNNVLNNYKKSYSDTAKMGKLSFQIIKIDVIDKNHAFVIGSWHLQRSMGDLGGHYTLLFRKIEGKWCIVVDHSS